MPYCHISTTGWSFVEITSWSRDWTLYADSSTLHHTRPTPSFRFRDATTGAPTTDAQRVFSDPTLLHRLSRHRRQTLSVPLRQDNAIYRLQVPSGRRLLQRRQKRANRPEEHYR
ncbi:hypothetical protein RvY_01824-2 [Ramazzottius varieornatus]|uniref:Uncharacterized protein n=1 Tax=Ramazzottius varieornatus TaxID=947166 RepID=A0A1D1UNN7_RAMVA|nr:hypothetical protein RvY_01824-2 [Ramazzottius varieornatus]